MSPPSKRDESAKTKRASHASTQTEKVLRYLYEIGSGFCSVTDEVITHEADPDMRQILVGLLVLHEDLAYMAGQRDVVQKEREKLLDQMQQALKARDDFLAVASHELRTPLMTLTLSLETLADKLRRAQTLEDIKGLYDKRVPTLQRQAQRLNSLVQEMSDVSQLSSGRLNMHPDKVDLVGVLEEVVDAFELECARHGVVLSFSNLAQRQGYRAVEGEWDRLRLEQVVANLVQNAIKYGNGQPIEVVLSVRGDMARVDVSDHGLGISPEDQARIFAPFFRSAQVGNTGGLGLGLWIAQRLAQMNGGKLSVVSTLQRGTTFSLDVPILATSSTFSPQPSEAERSANKKSRPSRPEVMHSSSG